MTAAATPAAPQSPWWIPRSGCPCSSCLNHPDPTAPAHRPPGCNRSTPPEVPHLTRVGPQRDPIPSPGGTTPWSNRVDADRHLGVAVGRGVGQRLELGLSARRAGTGIPLAHGLGACAGVLVTVPVTLCRCGHVIVKVPTLAPNNELPTDSGVMDVTPHPHECAALVSGRIEGERQSLTNVGRVQTAPKECGRCRGFGIRVSGHPAIAGSSGTQGRWSFWLPVPARAFGPSAPARARTAHHGHPLTTTWCAGTSAPMARTGCGWRT